MFNLVPKAYAVDIGTEFKLGDTGNSINSLSSLSVLISPFIQNAFVFGGVLFFIILVIGSIVYIMNAGSGDQQQLEKGKNALTAAVLGLIMVFAAYWIVQIVEFVTGVEIFNSGL